MSPEQLSFLDAGEPGPPDQAARDRTATDLDATLFVEAGAGSGKTRALVDRILALIDATPTLLQFPPSLRSQPACPAPRLWA